MHADTVKGETVKAYRVMVEFSSTEAAQGDPIEHLRLDSPMKR